MAEPRKALRQAITDTLWKIQELEATLLDFDGNQTLLKDRLEDYTAQLQNLQNAGRLSDLKIPVELLSYIDEGGNPDSYTAEIFNRANRANQYSKGKGEALEAFRKALESNLATAYPQEVKAYTQLMGQSEPPHNQKQA